MTEAVKQCVKITKIALYYIFMHCVTSFQYCINQSINKFMSKLKAGHK